MAAKKDTRSKEGPLYPDHTAEKAAKRRQQVKVDEVPDGSIAEVLEWVSGDKTRAEAAVKAEQKKGDKSRGSLVDSLSRVLNEDTGAGVASGEA
jgi:hypothetical protein